MYAQELTIRFMLGRAVAANDNDAVSLRGLPSAGISGLPAGAASAAWAAFGEQTATAASATQLGELTQHLCGCALMGEHVSGERSSQNALSPLRARTLLALTCSRPRAGSDDDLHTHFMVAVYRSHIRIASHCARRQSAITLLSASSSSLRVGGLARAAHETPRLN